MIDIITLHCNPPLPNCHNLHSLSIQTMLCPMSTDKSGSNWLDRLRSSRGFPANHDLNLEHFLNHPNPYPSDIKFADSTSTRNDPNPNTSLTPAQIPARDRNQLTEIRPKNGDKNWFGIMNNVLSELFIMGDYNNFPRKKSYRKQPNPKICVLSNENFQTENAPSPSSHNNSIRGNNKQVEVVNGGVLDGEDEEDTCRADLSAFSRTEVTVIDTSCGSWKFEKMLFRRKNVWKVRDKKSKGMINIGRKKRKASTLLGEDTSSIEKKPKLSSGHCYTLNVPPNEGFDPNDRVGAACKEGPDNLSQFPKTRLHRKLKKGSSSVVLIKSIPTTKKNVRSNPKSF